MNVGDKVKWAKGGKHGRTVSIRMYYGKIERIEGDTATVRQDTGRKVTIPIAELSPQDNNPYAIFDALAKYR